MTGQPFGLSRIAGIPPMLDGFKSTWVTYTITLYMFFPSRLASSNCAFRCKKFCYREACMLVMAHPVAEQPN